MQAEDLEDVHALSRNQSAEKVHLLCQLHFPDLVDVSSRFLYASMDIYYAILDSYDPLDKRSCCVQAAGNPAYKEARSEFIQARNALMNAIQASDSL